MPSYINNDGLEVRDAAVPDGGAIVCLLADGGPILPGAAEVRLAAAVPPEAAVPVTLGRGGLAFGVLDPEAVILLGLGLAAGVAALPFGFGGCAAGLGAGCSSTAMLGEGWINRPWFGGQSKYLSPLTEPSFLPSGSSSSSPT